MSLDLDALDRGIVARMRRWGPIALRLSLAVIFIWFGILKPLGVSPAVISRRSACRGCVGRYNAPSPARPAA